MSLRAILEINVHIESFKNVDLYNQGFYNSKIRVYHKQGEKVRNRF